MAISIKTGRSKERSAGRQEVVYCSSGCGNKVRSHGFGLQDVCHRPLCQDIAVSKAEPQRRANRGE